MKTFDELTRLEKARLTDEQVQIYCDIALMVAGIPKPIAPAYPSYFEVAAPDVPVYEVGNVSLKFASQEEAESLSAVLETALARTIQVGYDYEVGYEHKYVEGPPETTRNKQFGVSVSWAYSAEAFNQLRFELQANHKAKTIYDSEKREYEKNLRDARGVLSEIQDAVREAREFEQTVDRLRTQYQSYLDLSGGDKIKAQRFFVKTYPDVEADTLREVFGEEYSAEAHAEAQSA